MISQNIYGEILFLLSYLLFSCLQEEDIKPVVATLVEGATPDYEVELVYKHGESKFFITPYYKRTLDQGSESCNFCFVHMLKFN
jgi:hypothetical protein